MKIGINLVDTDLMRLRAFTPAVHGFLDTIRDGHPTTPLLIVSPIHCPIHEDTPGPGTFDLAALATGQVRFRATGDPAEKASGKLTLGVIRAELALPDQLHPDTVTDRAWKPPDSPGEGCEAKDPTQPSSPSCRARRTALVRSRAPSLLRIAEVWFLTVPSARNSASAICRLL